MATRLPWSNTPKIGVSIFKAWFCLNREVVASRLYFRNDVNEIFLVWGRIWDAVAKTVVAKRGAVA